MHAYIESRDCEVVYGDSVPADEPIYLLDETNAIHVKCIDSIASIYKPYE